MRGCWSGQTGQPQELLAYAYAGSNPVPRINFKYPFYFKFIPASHLLVPSFKIKGNKVFRENNRR